MQTLQRNFRAKISTYISTVAKSKKIIHVEIQLYVTPEVKKAVVKLQELSADERTKYLYESREMLRRDISAEKKWAREVGWQEGRPTPVYFR